MENVKHKEMNYIMPSFKLSICGHSLPQSTLHYFEANPRYAISSIHISHCTSKKPPTFKNIITIPSVYVKFHNFSVFKYKVKISQIASFFFILLSFYRSKLGTNILVS